MNWRNTLKRNPMSIVTILIGLAAGNPVYAQDCNSNAVDDIFELGAVVFEEAFPNLVIPDVDPIGVSSTINIPAGGTIADVDIGVHIDHPWQGDVVATLSHGGTTVVLINRVGTPGVGCFIPVDPGEFGYESDNFGADGSRLMLDDSASVGIDCYDGPESRIAIDNYAGPAQPHEPLSAFNGMDASGDWTLTVTDPAPAIVGFFVSWSLSVTEAGADCNNDLIPDECNFARDYIYAMNDLTDVIARFDEDGNNLETVVNATSGVHRGIAVDPDLGKILYSSYTSGQILRANLDGTNEEVLVAAPDGGALTIEIDAVNDRIYWVGNDNVYRSFRDGSGVEVVLSGSEDVTGLALDNAGGRIYFTEPNAGRIKSANLDGSDVQTLIDTGLTSPIEIDVDPAGGKFYFTQNSGELRRANLDGSGVEDIYPTGANLAGLQLDLANGEVYFSDYGSDEILRANMDGTSVETVAAVTNAFRFSLIKASEDCNLNGILDQCDPDADGDGIPDDCTHPSNVHCVRAGATGAGDGSGWFDAYPDLQSAIAAAVNGDEIWVAAGTYTPGAARGDTFGLKTGVSWYGGFAGFETSREQRDPAANVTILSGDLLGDDNSGGSIAENAYHVISGTGLNNTPLVDGFTITAGNTDGAQAAGFSEDGAAMLLVHASPQINDCVFIRNNGLSGDSTNGGAVYCASGSHPTFTNCDFIANTADNHGGAIATFGASVTVEGCNFIRNDMYRGAIAVLAGTLNVDDCLFEANTASFGRGGAIHYSGSTATILNSRFHANSNYTDGGGVFMGNSSADSVIANCTFVGNSSGEGGAIDIFRGSVINCTITANRAAIDGGGIIVRDGGDVTIANNIIHGNISDYDGSDGGPFNDETAQVFRENDTPTVVEYNLIENLAALAGQTANIGGDPTFLSAPNDGGDGWGVGGNDDFGNLELSIPDSPCIDAGDNAAIPAGLSTDLVGNPRRLDVLDVVDTGNGLDAIVDMGAIERIDLADPDGDGVPNFADVCPLVADDQTDTDGDGMGDACDACPNRVTGDVNDDDEFDINDVPMFAALLVDPSSASPDDLCAADFNEDGSVNGLDIQGLMELILAP